MSTKGRSAWLITWEGDDAKNLGRPKVVAVLSSQLGEANIALILRVLFCSEYPFTLCEKVGMGTARRRDMPNLLIKAHRDMNPGFYYGYFAHSYLYARRVKNLRCEESKKSAFECTLSWVEWPKYRYDEATGKTKVILAERQDCYTYSTKRP
jgi:hypothetical protein